MPLRPAILSMQLEEQLKCLQFLSVLQRKKKKARQTMAFWWRMRFPKTIHRHTARQPLEARRQPRRANNIAAPDTCPGKHCIATGKDATSTPRRWPTHAAATARHAHKDHYLRVASILTMGGSCPYRSTFSLSVAFSPVLASYSPQREQGAAQRRQQKRERGSRQGQWMASATAGERSTHAAGPITAEIGQPRLPRRNGGDAAGV